MPRPVGKLLNTKASRYARSRIEYLVSIGELPEPSTLKCTDCNSDATEYHHENHKEPEIAIPVCRSCHVKRDIKLGNRKPPPNPGLRQRKKIGPLTKHGHFFSASSEMKQWRGL